MSRKVVILPEAKRDLRQAIQWYDQESEGLGLRFMEAVDGKLNSLSANPEIYAIVHRQGRIVKIDPYSYIIVYTVDPDQLLIFAVVHTSRDPAIWQNRLP